MTEEQAKYGKVPEIVRRKIDLCQAMGMSQDLTVLLHRAIESYDNDKSLADFEKARIRYAKEYLEEINKINSRYGSLLLALSEMSGLDIMKIGYDKTYREIVFGKGGL